MTEISKIISTVPWAKRNIEGKGAARRGKSINNNNNNKNLM